MKAFLQSPRAFWLWLLILFGVMLAGSRSARATEAYALREAKACQYCHISSSPGMIDPDTKVPQSAGLNPRGVYYQAHNHTFQGYVEAEVMKPQPSSVVVKTLPNLFRFLWKEELPDPARRLAVADVEGDGQPRLITLDEKPDSKDASTLLIRKWDGKAFVTEFTGDVQAAADKMEVGQFAGKEKPPVIVTADALWYWDGKTFVRKAAAHPLPLLGSLRQKEGDERLILADDPAAIKTYHVQIGAVGDWLTDAADPPPSAKLTAESFQNTPQFFSKMGMPDLISVGGLFGVWEASKTSKLLMYYMRPDQDFDIINDPVDYKKTKFVLKKKYCFVVFTSPYDENAYDLWTTPRLRGFTLDIARADVKSGNRPGLLILTSDSADGKGRTLYFFGLGDAHPNQ